MCVIFQLRPGYTLPYTMLETAVWNNPHGYGIVIKINNRLQVIKKLADEKKGSDPKEIYKILKDNEDAERFVHVRWRTEGDISGDNLHPFPVYNSNKRQVWFMHNGTLHQYAPPRQYSHMQGGMTPVSTDTRSDSRKFAETVVAPFLLKFHGENGPADIHDETIKEIFEKYWSSGNKGLLIANDLDPYFLGLTNWTTIKTSEIDKNGKSIEGSFFSSNNEYYLTLKRGPVFEAREVERKKKEEVARLANVNKPAQTEKVDTTITRLTSKSFSQKFSLDTKMEDLLEDYNMYDAEGYISLANLTIIELDALVKTNPEGVPSLLLYLTDFLKKNTEALIKLEEKHESATKMIATLKHKLEATEKELVTV